MKKQQRLNRIIEMLQRENGLPIQTLSRHLGVSHMTVRRDLEQLVEQNQVKLIHGGVILVPGSDQQNGQSPYSLNTAETVRIEEKRRIGVLASGLIEPQDTLIIDSGSTTEFLARSVPADMRLTIICYALNIISATARLEQCRQVFAGGVMHENTLMFESPEGIQLVKRHRATKAFLSAAGVHADFGVTCLNAYERATKQAAIESSEQKILLVDSSKFGLIRSDYFAELGDFDAVVTDGAVSQEYVTQMEELGIQVHLA
ncbi:MAG: DeoR/GlpR transcriptional regulator [Spirochaetaceae bacterium]|nr:MAG: DeoR/GlpR transcriptional regulator [Spirochaetaceae bacterium]